MTERNWVYFANENSKVWGYPVPACQGPGDPFLDP